MIDAVVGYHSNPATCGVVKFERQLAERLGVPWVRWDAYVWRPNMRPLLSIKYSELAPAHVGHFYDRFIVRPFDLFAHDRPHLGLLTKAVCVYAANAEIAKAIRPIRNDVIDAWCPATIHGNPHRAALNVLTFGMAHKLQLPHYQKLKVLLDATGQDYTVSLSTAVHEGSPWDAVAEAGTELRAIFGDNLRELGYLADDALAKELQDCSAVALFFDPALRANNTTFWAAVEAEKLIITNLDADSPTPNGPSWVKDIHTLTAWPGTFEHWQYVGGYPPYTWDGLVQLLGAHVSV